MNETPNVFINRVRLEKAAHLLKAGIDSSIAEVADECGFSSAAVFNRSFKEFYKMTPVVFSKSPSTLFSADVKQSSIKSLDIEIVYLPNIYIYGIATSISNTRLMDAIEQAEDFCKKNGIDADGRKMGILTYNTLHHPEANKNYHLGISVDVTSATKYIDQLFLLSKGKYACFSTSESVRSVREILMDFKVGWLDSSPYAFQDLIAYEEFFPENKNSKFPYFNRKIYIPVKLK
jgi:effector-binding domain-containing protein